MSVAVANRKSVTRSITTPTKSVGLSTAPNLFSFDAIDRRRWAQGLTIPELCQAAEINPRTWERAKADPARVSSRTITKLEAALDAAAGPKRPKPGLVLAFVNAATSLLAGAVGLAPHLSVLTQDFNVQKPLDKAWLTASQLRRTAMWLAIVECDVARKDVAEACACSRQNIAQAIQFVEKRMEEEPSFAAIVERIAFFLNPQRSEAA